MAGPMSKPAGAIRTEDLYRFRWLDHVRLSPDGERVAYQVGWADAEARENRGAVVVQRLAEGSEPAAVAGSDRRSHFPEWSPDGSDLAFLGRCGTRDQLFVASAEGGQATRLTDCGEGVTALCWSPDGSRIAFLARGLAEPEAVIDDPRPPEYPNQVRRPPVTRATRRLDYKRDGTGYLDGRRSHLFVVEVVPTPRAREGQGQVAAGSVRQLTDGAWSVEDLDWAPDGRLLAVTGDADPEADLRRESHLHLVDLDGVRRTLVPSMKISEPAWSPGGDLIAFLAPNGGAAGLHERVWVVPAAGGTPRCLTLDLDRSCDGDVLSDMRAGHQSRLVWSQTGDRLFFQAAGPGIVELCSVDLDGRVRTELASARRAIYSFDVRAGQIAACAADPTNPGDVVVVEAGREHRLTDENPWLRERFVAIPERQEFVAEDGLRIEGWLLKPAHHDPSRKYPLILQIHGGPHAQYGWAFFHEFQVLVGMGFLVLFVNPRGSDGYGEPFKQAVVRDWGGADYRDLMCALDELILRTGFVDEERLGVAGGSYGGYLTNWAVSQSERFRAAVAMRSISNLVSDYTQHDIVPWTVEELGPPPWEVLDELWRRSPIRYADRIRTPLLLLHSEMDLRCPISQAEELFGALRLLGREVEMVRFPGESHDLSRSGRPDRRVERLNRIADWFEQHLLKGRESALASQPEAASTVPQQGT
jgi:dipeptidyl aminopeptidase/acylaminoacyl peptidase